MKTRRIARSSERTFSKIGRKKETNLEEYESDVLEQTLSQFYAFGNSVILPSMLLPRNHNGSSEKLRINITWVFRSC